MSISYNIDWINKEHDEIKHSEENFAETLNFFESSQITLKKKGNETMQSRT